MPLSSNHVGTDSLNAQTDQDKRDDTILVPAIRPATTHLRHRSVCQPAAGLTYIVAFRILHTFDAHQRERD